jgi:hypothetical protein
MIQKLSPSCSDVAPVRSPAIMSFDRLSWHGARPPLSGFEIVCSPPIAFARNLMKPQLQ